MSINDKNKTLLMAFISGILVILICIVTFKLIETLNDSASFDTKKELENKVYATVSEVGDNYIRVKSIDGNDKILTINTTLKTSIGDFLIITYNADEIDFITPNSIETIAHAKEIEFTPKETTKPSSTITSKSKITTEIKSTSKVMTTKLENTSKVITTKENTSEKTTTYNSNKDRVVLTFAEENTNAIASYKANATFKEKAKKTFITIVDFIFYNGEIKGITWNDISTKTKAKIVYYALIMDSKIEKKWPDYKMNISSKYKDIKAKLIAKYMDITTSICENHSLECTQVKEDFGLLKKSLSLTWDILKSAFQYGYEKSASYLKNWYEVFRGKA